MTMEDETHQFEGGQRGWELNSIENLPCLLCGTLPDVNESLLTLNDIVVKEEIITDAGSEECAENIENDVLPSINEKSMFENDRKDEEDAQGKKYRKWTEDEKRIYQWFLKMFQVKLTPRKKRRSDNHLEWNTETGQDVFPFCSLCNNQMMGLMKMQNELDELVIKIKNQVKDLKYKVKSCEDSVRETGIYGRDVRYKRVRKQILVFCGYEQSRKKDEDFEPTRKLRGRGKRTRDILGTTSSNVDETCDNEESDPTYIDTLSLKDVQTTSRMSVNQEDLPDSSRINKYEVTGDEDFDWQTVEAPISDESRDNVETAQQNINNSLETETALPTSTRRRSSRKRKVNTRVDDADELNDDDYNPSPSTKPPFKKRKQKEKKSHDDEDKDWLPNEEINSFEDDHIHLSSPSEEDVSDDANYDFELDLKSKKYAKVVEDTEKRTLSYKKLVFQQLEPFSSNKYECADCGTELVCRKNKSGYSQCLRAHYVKAHTTLYACKICDFRGSSKTKLKLHVSTIHKGLPSRRHGFTDCPICGRPTSSPHLKIHLWSHKNSDEKAEILARGGKDLPYAAKKNHQCEECGRGFCTPSSLLKHQTVHTKKESRMELCHECGGTVMDLKKHQKYVHGMGGSSDSTAKMHKCIEPGCGKEFKILSALIKHRDAVHRKITPFKCTQCPRSFVRQALLDNHMNLHLGIRPWQCDHCPSAFARKSNLQKHIGHYHVDGCNPKRKPFIRGPTMLAVNVKAKDLKKKGKYLPPSALASWAAGREPTSHFPTVDGTFGSSLSANDDS